MWRGQSVLECMVYVVVSFLAAAASRGILTATSSSMATG